MLVEVGVLQSAVRQLALADDNLFQPHLASLLDEHGLVQPRDSIDVETDRVAVGLQPLEAVHLPEARVDDSRELNRVDLSRLGQVEIAQTVRILKNRIYR